MFFKKVIYIYSFLYIWNEHANTCKLLTWKCPWKGLLADKNKKL
uniref:Uncharacterized protein n=1 Tax=Meloidogyne enterolobii TaxID=390850 RepID=A0A6V7WLX4_MELEN|nr:unnamed protein product [Meloidogyne enterolobii]